MNDQIARVKDQTDIVALVGEHVKLTKAGSNFKGLCPFHSERTPSFFVNPSMQRYMCFGCHETGDVFTFLEKYDNMTFAESLRLLAKRAGIELAEYRESPEDQKRERILAALSLAREYYHYLLTEHALGQKTRDYLWDRGTTQETIKLFGLGTSLPSWDGLQKYLIGKKGFTTEELLDAGLILRSERGTYYDRFRDRLMFPLTNTRGIVVGFSGRSLNPDEKTAKYINSPETSVYHKSELLFGYSQLHRFIREKEEIIIVEGEFDCLSSFQAHVNNVSAIKGSALTQEQLKLLARSVKRIIFSLDNDKAGIEATKRAITLAHDYDISLRVIPLSGGKDPDDIARSDPGRWRKMVKESVTVYDYLIDQCFLSHDSKSGDGKREITNELGPLIMGITNAVEQAHYVQKIAKRLTVAEDILFSQFRKKMPRIQPMSAVSEKREKPRDREETLETYLFTLLFHMKGEEFVSHIERLHQLARHPMLIKLLTQVTHPRMFTLSSFMNSLPEELKAVFFQLYMRDGETVEKQEKTKEFNASERELVELRHKKERESIAARITTLEEKVDITPEEEAQLHALQRQIMG